jgi:hypothetical protein
MSTQQLRSGRGFGGQVGIVLNTRRRRGGATSFAGASSLSSSSLRRTATATSSAGGGRRLVIPPRSVVSEGEGGHEFPSTTHHGAGRDEESSGGGALYASDALLPSLSWDDVLCRLVYNNTSVRPTEAAACAVRSSEAEQEEDDDEGESDRNKIPNGSSPSAVATTQQKERDESASGVAVPHWICSAKGLKSWSGAARSNGRSKNRTYTTARSRLRVLGFLTSGGDGGDVRGGSIPVMTHDGDACRSGESQTERSRTVPSQPSTGASAAPVNGSRTSDETGTGSHEPRKKQRTILHSTLRVAREYFRNLDSHHPLMLDHSSASSKDDEGRVLRQVRSGAVEGRSVRPILESNPIVSREYQSHHQACQEVGVSPLLWKHFLQQRRLYHATMYEGILDD